MSRQEVLVACLQRLFFVTEVIQVTAPTGSFIPRGGTSTTQTKAVENVFRYDPIVRAELCRCLSDLRLDLPRSNAIFLSLAQETKAGKWLIFGDGSVGLLKPDRQSLLTACQVPSPHTHTPVYTPKHTSLYATGYNEESNESLYVYICVSLVVCIPPSTSIFM